MPEGLRSKPAIDKAKIDKGDELSSQMLQMQVQVQELLGSEASTPRQTRKARLIQHMTALESKLDNILES